MEPSAGNDKLKVLMILHMGIGTGVALFLFVIYFISAGGNPPTGEPLDIVQILGYIGAAAFVAGVFIGPILFNMQLRNIKLQPGKPANDESLYPFLGFFLTGHILRLAMTEMPALLSAVTILLYVQSTGTINLSDPLVQLPSAVIALFYAIWIFWFPTKGNVLSSIRKFA